MIEICFGGVWGSICDDGWDDSDSRVACKQLGYIEGYDMYVAIDATTIF